ncbi:MAG TPA: ligase-associated DNA damage response DEXH box helicase [Burkholderiaceae bacterium]|nr:ligase-associated DNA damage response DEXH box helicase [Burkholderiaceae bacterium]
MVPREPNAEAWFALRGWQPFAFQREVWAAMAAGRSGLLHATTGSGKTYAVWLGALARSHELDRARPRSEGAGRGGGAKDSAASASGPQVLWLTPMRALAADTQRALELPLPELAPRWTVGLRTGDTSASERARQERKLPTALVTTPESLTLLLTRADASERLAGVQTVIVDEWHELVGNKRGVQVQLALARLRRWNPRLVVWGLSATLGNLADAMRMLLSHDAGALVQGKVDKPLVVDTLLPTDPGRFSWGGHLGAQMEEPVVNEIERSGTTLVFTNVRSQAEIWYQMLLRSRPEWAGRIALHHGSLDKAVRAWVEQGLKAGTLKAVVATSSLDLGVDFLPVERVLQIGSAKGVARLLQRAGRSGHQPGRASRITLVPTHTLELVEAVAARRAVAAGRVEPRFAPDKPLDVLVQHLVSIALGGGFVADELFDEVRTAWSYRDLTRDEFGWALDFVTRGGSSLKAYPEYHRVVRGDDGVYRVSDRGIALRHRLQVGTIVAEASMLVKWLSGGTIGQIEEGFIARLNKGDHFVFAGRVLEYVRTQDMAAYVRKASRKSGIVPAWAGSRMALSSELADATLQALQSARQGDFFEPELQAAQPMLQAQSRLSKLPTPDTLLIEQHRSREGHHVFIYPFAGRTVHLGLASLLAWRLSRQRPNTFSMSFNDYGFELLAAEPIDASPLLDGGAFDDAELLHDVLASLNSSELALRRFREIARVAGLVFTGYPGAPKSTKQLQASSSLFYEVFRKYDPGNRLLGQADAEVLAQELDLRRLRASLKRMRARRVEAVTLRVPSPFALALMVERFREELSTQKLADRLARILREANEQIDAPAAESPRRSAPRRRIDA